MGLVFAGLGVDGPAHGLEGRYLDEFLHHVQRLFVPVGAQPLAGPDMETVAEVHLVGTVERAEPAPFGVADDVVHLLFVAAEKSSWGTRVQPPPQRLRMPDLRAMVDMAPSAAMTTSALMDSPVLGLDPG